MSCYFRHLNEIFSEAGIEVTKENRKQLDQAIHQILETDYKNCPQTWAKLKKDIFSDKDKRLEFIKRIREFTKNQVS